MAKEKKYPCLITKPIAELKPSQCQSRQHSSVTTEQARKSLLEFSLLAPPTFNVRTGQLLSLRSVVEASAILGVKEMPVWCVDLDEAHAEAAELMLNSHLNEMAWEQVADKLKRVVAAGLPLTLTGMPESDTGPLLAADWKKPEKKPLNDVQAAPGQGGFGF